jgi:hypothetical protein
VIQCARSRNLPPRPRRLAGPSPPRTFQGVFRPRCFFLKGRGSPRSLEFRKRSGRAR